MAAMDFAELYPSCALDRPVTPGDDSFVCGGRAEPPPLLRGTKQRSNPAFCVAALWIASLRS
jgi:hypothetical protein